MVDLLRPVEGAAADVIAEALIAEFGSLPDLLAASSEQHRRVGISDRTAALLAATRGAVRRVSTARLESRPLLARSSDVREYLRVHIGFEHVETVRVLYLDAARRLVAEEEAGRGGPDEAPFYVRAILTRALELGATGVLVAHNHPSGFLRASDADCAITGHLAQAAEIVGIALLDHVVVTRTGCVSIMAEAMARCSRKPIWVRPAAIVSSFVPDRCGTGACGTEECVTDRGVMSMKMACRAPQSVDDPAERLRLSAALRAIIRLRKDRDALFPPGLFFDPCWNMLLDVFACELDGRTVSIKSACLAADVPFSTASRWIDALCEKRVLVRWKDPHDRRRSYLRLSDAGRSAMLAYVHIAGL